MFKIVYQDGYIGRRIHFFPKAIKDQLIEDQFTSQLHVVGIGHYPHSLYHYMDRPQGCDEYILIYCVDGKGFIKYNGIISELKAGTFFILPPQKAHTYWADEANPWSIYWVHFEGSNAPFFGTGCDHVCQINFSKSSRIAQRLELFEELFSLIESSYSLHNLRYATSLLSHFLGTFKYLNEYRSFSSTTDEGSLSIINRGRHYMIENMERYINMDNLCSYLGISQSYCTALFKSQTGMSPMRYLNNLRVQKAAQLLSGSNMKINQICQKVGISDPYYFSRFFSKAIGISPTQYRDRFLSIKEHP